MGKDDPHPHLVVFGIKNETKLKKCLLHLDEAGIPYREFREPDIGNQLTAIATAPIVGEDRKHLAKYCLLTSPNGVTNGNGDKKEATNSS